MKKIAILSLFLLLAKLADAQSVAPNVANDTLQKAAPALTVTQRTAVITDEGTNEPGSEYQKTTLNGKDIYIKKENQITIIYEPQK
jgi:hypothetical protein